MSRSFLFLALLGVACSGNNQGGESGQEPLDWTVPTDVACRYVESWIRGDGTHREYEHPELPATVVNWSATLHDLPANEENVNLKAIGIWESGGPEEVEANHGFGVAEGCLEIFGTSTDIVCLVVGVRVTYSDGTSQSADVALRPEVLIAPGSQPIFDEPVTWKVVPRRPLEKVVDRESLRRRSR